MNILYLEDDTKLSLLIKQHLDKNYNVDVVDTARKAFEKIITKPYTLIMVDYYLPDINGLDFCKKLRDTDSITPILFLTILENKENIVDALDSGADDYLSKPFSLSELEARIRVLIRRLKNPKLESRRNFRNQIKVDHSSRKIEIDQNYFELPRKEYFLLKYFLHHGKRVISRCELFENVWGDEDYYNSNTIDVHVKRLRQKLSLYTHVNNIESVYGEGYRFIEK